jgi:hypothetical protein
MTGGRSKRMAAGHCTGQFAFAEMIRLFGPRFNANPSYTEKISLKRFFTAAVLVFR